MSEKPSHVTVLGLDVAFRQEADLERIQTAAKFLEERYAHRKSGTYGNQGKDNLLILIALELADELLQLKASHADMRARIDAMLEKIKESR